MSEERHAIRDPEASSNTAATGHRSDVHKHRYQISVTVALSDYKSDSKRG